MTTTLSQFITIIRGYTGFQDPDVQSDELITSWVRMMEERASSDLRISHQVQIDTATIYEQRVQLPLDWRSNDFVRIVDGAPLSFKPRKEFYDLTGGTGYFTVSGRFLIIGGTPDAVDGKEIEMTYFGDVPQLTDEVGNVSWLVEKCLTVAVAGTMSFAADAMVDNSINWEDRFNTRVGKLNSEYLESISKGSGISRRVGSFG